MDNKGFTLVELLVSLVLIGIFSLVIVYFVHGTLSTTMTQIDSISDNQIYEASKSYVIENNMFKGSDSVCITVQNLIDYGYLDNTISDELKGKKILITRNSNSVIQSVEYVVDCE